MDRKRIGQQIARRRKQLGLSTTELARRVHLSQPQISRLENGQQGFRSETLTRISSALGVPPAYFFSEEALEVGTSLTEDRETRRAMGSEFAERLNRQYGELAVTPGFRRIVERLAATVSNPEADNKTLRQLLNRILSMKDEDRRELLRTIGRRRRVAPTAS